MIVALRPPVGGTSRDFIAAWPASTAYNFCFIWE
jgi:hypothetical protein